MYVLGSLLFVIDMFRAHILPRWAAALLAVSGPLAGTMFTLLPYQLVQLTSIPIGAAMVWLGYALFSERREKPSESLLDQGIVSQEPSKVA
jgi:membrane protein implicated in regulation of membrane protease activity